MTGPVPPGTRPAGPGSTDETVELRFLVAGAQPLVVGAVGAAGRAAQLHDALAEHGFATLPAFLGADLPRGARVGFQIHRDELRLVDEREDTLLRAPRAGIDPAWLDAAKRLRGTMMVVATGLEMGPDTPVADLARAVDERARAGAVLGAIIGVVEERPTLPLLFG